MLFYGKYNGGISHLSVSFYKFVLTGLLIDRQQH